MLRLVLETVANVIKEIQHIVCLVLRNSAAQSIGISVRKAAVDIQDCISNETLLNQLMEDFSTG